MEREGREPNQIPLETNPTVNDREDSASISDGSLSSSLDSDLG